MVGVSESSGAERGSTLKMFILFTIVTAIAAGLACCATSPPSRALPLRTVDSVDLKRYVGIWYEIARYPNSFQKGCRGSAASYTLREDGEIDVVNGCRDATDGGIRQAKGRAWVVDTATNARLKVSFFWPFRGDYWIIGLGPAYEYAVVGTPNRKYLWILSRTPVMDDKLYAAILERVKELGFAPEKIVRDPAALRANGEP